MTKPMDLETAKRRHAALKKRIEKLTEERKTLWNDIQLMERRIELSALIGKDAGVVIGYGARDELRGKRGTVLEVKRTRALVGIDGKQWLFPFDLLKANEFEFELEAAVNRGFRN